MSRYIEVEEAVDRIGQILPKRTDSDYQRGIAVGMSLAKIGIEGVPTVDAVPVVRCKDCKYWYSAPLSDGYNSCSKDALIRGADFFCADGEKVTE